MKYGRLVFYANPTDKTKTQYVNVGDIFQTLAVDLVYEKAGIAPQDIVNIDRYGLRDYDGEEVLLPLNGWFGKVKGSEIFPMSEKIHPLYLGFHDINPKDAKRFTGNDFIGCRDEYTYDLIRKHCPNAYISGCMTLLFPKRTAAPADGKTFIVDVSAKTYAHIPKELRDKALRISHEVPMDFDNDKQTEIRRLEDAARSYIERYRTEAELVITSRLHCAMVCVACGIPVVLMRESFDERYAFLDKFLPLYDAGEYDKIDWHPTPPDVDEIKAQTLSLALSALSGTIDRAQTEAVHSCYMHRTRHKISTPFMVKAYDKVRDISPALADFIRGKILFRFTIAYGRNEQEEQK